jgi:hypothetical protein
MVVARQGCQVGNRGQTFPLDQQFLMHWLLIRWEHKKFSQVNERHSYVHTDMMVMRDCGNTTLVLLLPAERQAAERRMIEHMSMLLCLM